MLRATTADAESILALQKLAYKSEAAIYNNYRIPPLVQTVEEMKKDIEQQNVLKVSFAGKLAASIRTRVKDDTCYIGRLIVRPDLQGTGIGTLLLEIVEYDNRACKRYELFTGEKSEKNIGFYEKRGYKIFKAETQNDGLVLVFLEKRSLGDSTPEPIEGKPMMIQMTDSQRVFFGVKKTRNRTPEYLKNQESLLAREIAIGHYIMARSCMWYDYFFTSALLAQQAMEMYTKSIIKFRGLWAPDKMERQHNVIPLMKLVEKDIPEFSTILNDSRQRQFLGELPAVYETMRFGEAAVFGAVHQKIASMLDELALAFEMMFVGGENPKERVRIFVHFDLRAAFFMDNKHFTPEMTTENPLSNRSVGFGAPERMLQDVRAKWRPSQYPRLYYYVSNRLEMVDLEEAAERQIRKGKRDRESAGSGKTSESEKT